MPQRFNTGCAVMWSGDDAYEYGVVLENDGGMMEIVPVRPNEEDVRCFDEGGSIYDRDKDNVRLRLCPPPFSMLCALSYGNSCYALAGEDDRFRVHESEVDLYFMEIVDEGDLVKQPDLDDIRDHPWRDEKEKHLQPPGGQAARFAPEPEPVPAAPKALSPRERIAMALELENRVAGGRSSSDYEYGG